MTEHGKAACVRRLYDALSARDMETIESLVTDDVALHHVGPNPVAGDYKGREGLMEFLDKGFEITGGTLDADLICTIRPSPST